MRGITEKTYGVKKEWNGQQLYLRRKVFPECVSTNAYCTIISTMQRGGGRDRRELLCMRIGNGRWRRCCVSYDCHYPPEMASLIWQHCSVFFGARRHTIEQVGHGRKNGKNAGRYREEKGKTRYLYPNVPSYYFCLVYVRE